MVKIRKPYLIPGKGKKGEDAGPDDQGDGDQHQFGQVVPGQEVGPFQPAFENLADGGGELRHHLVGFQEARDGIQQDVGPEQDAEQVGAEHDQSEAISSIFEKANVDFGSFPVGFELQDGRKEQQVAEEQESAGTDADAEGDREDEREGVFPGSLFREEPPEQEEGACEVGQGEGDVFEVVLCVAEEGGRDGEEEEGEDSGAVPGKPNGEECRQEDAEPACQGVHLVAEGVDVVDVEPANQDGGDIVEGLAVIFQVGVRGIEDAAVGATGGVKVVDLHGLLVVHLFIARYACLPGAQHHKNQQATGQQVEEAPGDFGPAGGGAVDDGFIW